MSAEKKIFVTGGFTLTIFCNGKFSFVNINDYVYCLYMLFLLVYTL